MDFELPEEMRAFRDSVHGWVNREVPKDYARRIEAQQEFPFDLWDKMSAAGYHGVSIAEEYGGGGGDVVAQAVLCRELARSLGGLCQIWGATSFAGSKSVGIYGTEEQKRRYLPAIAAGKARFSIAFTEPDGGTDVLGAMKTSATRVDGGWTISGRKTWCTGADVADFLLLLARTEPDAAKKHQGLTLFIVPARAEGIYLSKLPKLGIRCYSSFEVGFDEVFVPDADVLGEAGKAWYMLLPTINNERILIAATCLGIIDGVLEDAVAYAMQRKAFGHAIGEFQAIQHYIADMIIWQHQSELLTYRAAAIQASGKDCYREATVAKITASEAAVKAADLGIQILGGMGYSAETDMQRYWRDARLFRFAPITNEAARNSLAEGAGLPRSY
ncbi:MAG: acyl-CoA dehydrogenase family protein [Rhizobiaceae bacterium]